MHTKAPRSLLFLTLCLPMVSTGCPGDDNSGGGETSYPAGGSSASGGGAGVGGGEAGGAEAGPGGGPGSGDSSTSDPTAGDTGSGSCGAGGEIDHAFSPSMDECSHEMYVAYMDVMSVSIDPAGTEVALQILGSPGLEEVTGTVGRTCNVTATGTGTVAGYPDIQVDWEGVLDAQGFTGSLTLGGAGQLPGGCPIVYAVAPN